MKCLIAERPDTHIEQIQWLESLLTGHDLRQYVSELLAVDNKVETLELQQLPDFELSQVLQNGLEDSSPQLVSQLINEPSCLLQLHDEVFQHGGDYWIRKIKENQEMQSTIERTRAAIENHIGDSGSSETISGQVEQSKQSVGQKTSHPGRTMWLTLAAAIVVACGIGFLVSSNLTQNNRQVASWGWLADDAMQNDLDQAQYLNKLARGADTWFNQRPGELLDVRKRIEEFKSGCQKLIAADHANLDQANREWLKDRLETCLRDVEEQLAEASSQGADAIRIRSAVDQIVRDVASDLKIRARQV